MERGGKRETTDRVSGRKARERSRRRHGQGDSAIRAPTWQDVTCGEQEEETGQIQINLVAAPENMSIPLEASVAANVLIKAYTFGLFPNFGVGLVLQLTWRQQRLSI